MRGNKGRFLSRLAAERAARMKALRLEQATPETLPCLRGRRIIEFEVLINNLKACISCKQGLRLENIVNETIQGLGSLLHVKCHSCSAVNLVPTGKRQQQVLFVLLY